MNLGVKAKAMLFNNSQSNFKTDISENHEESAALGYLIIVLYSHLLGFLWGLLAEDCCERDAL